MWEMRDTVLKVQMAKERKRRSSDGASASWTMARNIVTILPRCREALFNRRFWRQSIPRCPPKERRWQSESRTPWWKKPSNCQKALGEIQWRIQELQDAFRATLQKAAENSGEDYAEQFRPDTKELAILKRQRDEMDTNLREKGSANDRSPHFMQWDENWIWQLVHTEKVISGNHIQICLINGTVIQQEVCKV